MIIAEAVDNPRKVFWQRSAAAINLLQKKKKKRKPTFKGMVVDLDSFQVAEAEKSPNAAVFLEG